HQRAAVVPILDHVAGVHDLLVVAEVAPGQERTAHRPGFHARHIDVGNADQLEQHQRDRKSTRLNSSHVSISYAVFCLKQKTQMQSRFDLVCRLLLEKKKDSGVLKCPNRKSCATMILTKVQHQAHNYTLVQWRQ